MSVAGIGSTNPASSIPVASSYFTQRNADARQLAQALKAGNLSDAQQAFSSLAALGPLPGSSSTSGAPFSDPKLAGDFQGIGQSLESGDLAGARQAFQTLQQDFRANERTHGTIEKVPPSGEQSGDGGSSATGINLTA